MGGNCASCLQRDPNEAPMVVGSPAKKMFLYHNDASSRSYSGSSSTAEGDHEHESSDHDNNDIVDLYKRNHLLHNESNSSSSNSSSYQENLHLTINEVWKQNLIQAEANLSLKGHGGMIPGTTNSIINDGTAFEDSRSELDEDSDVDDLNKSTISGPVLIDNINQTQSQRLRSQTAMPLSPSQSVRRKSTMSLMDNSFNESDFADVIEELGDLNSQGLSPGINGSSSTWMTPQTSNAGTPGTIRNFNFLKD